MGQILLGCATMTEAIRRAIRALRKGAPWPSLDAMPRRLAESFWSGTCLKAELDEAA
jgi:hypothetical protein